MRLSRSDNNIYLSRRISWSAEIKFYLPWKFLDKQGKGIVERLNILLSLLSLLFIVRRTLRWFEGMVLFTLGATINVLVNSAPSPGEINKDNLGNFGKEGRNKGKVGLFYCPKG